MKSLKDQILTKPVPQAPSDLLEVIGGALKATLSDDQLDAVESWIAKSYSANHVQSVERLLKRNSKAKPFQSIQTGAKQGKQPIEISDKKVLRSQKEVGSKNQKNKPKSKKKGDGNDSQVSIPAQSEGTFTNTDLNFLNDTQDLAEPKKIDTTMSVQAMHT